MNRFGGSGFSPAGRLPMAQEQPEEALPGTQDGGIGEMIGERLGSGLRDKLISNYASNQMDNVSVGGPVDITDIIKSTDALKGAEGGGFLSSIFGGGAAAGAAGGAAAGGAAAGGLGGTIAKVAPILLSIFSDIRVKKNIKQVGKSPSGIPVYEFSYKGDKNKRKYRGAIANDFPNHPAVSKDSSGLYNLDYSKIDVDFEDITDG